MKYTNVYGLPEAFVNAVKRDPYTNKADISVTQLTNPPRQYWLNKRHKDEIVVDVSSRIWALFGTSVHSILEKSTEDNAMVEERMIVDSNGWTVGGKPDYFDETKIQDWKVTSAWTLMNDEHKPEYVAQLNFYNYLLNQHSFTDIKWLENVLILRDWSKTKARTEKNYPPVQIEVVQQELWRIHDTKKLLDERVSLIQSCESLDDKGLPLCSKEERWHKQDKWAVKKTGNKKASKLCDTEAEAAELVSKKWRGVDIIEFREAEDQRCLNYCDVCQFCDFWQSKYGNAE